MTDLSAAPWTITVEQRPFLACCALWLRAAERLSTPADSLVPGPLDVATLPSPGTAGDRDRLGQQWVTWWHSIVGPPRDARTGSAEPAHGTIDPLGLAGQPELAALVAERGPEAVRWHASGAPEEHVLLAAHRLVVGAEERVGRPAGAFDLHLTLLPVRDQTIRTAVPGRQYLVPECVFGGVSFDEWLTDIVERIM
jgi:hypothetical protein